MRIMKKFVTNEKQFVDRARKILHRLVKKDKFSRNPRDGFAKGIMYKSRYPFDIDPVMDHPKIDIDQRKITCK